MLLLLLFVFVAATEAAATESTSGCLKLIAYADNDDDVAHVVTRQFEVLFTFS